MVCMSNLLDLQFTIIVNAHQGVNMLLWFTCNGRKRCCIKSYVHNTYNPSLELTITRPLRLKGKSDISTQWGSMNRLCHKKQGTHSHKYPQSSSKPYWLKHWSVFTCTPLAPIKDMLQPPRTITMVVSHYLLLTFSVQR
jgi:hypothetical protein